MLTRIVVVGTSALLTFSVIYAQPALADDHGPPIVVTSGDGIGIDTSVTTPGAAGSSVSTVPASTGSAVSCSYTPDTSNHSAGIPDWELKNPHTGEQGAWFFRQCTDGSFNVVWIPSDNPPPGVRRVTPAQLATQAANYLPLPAPDVHHSPGDSEGRPQTVVGIDTWFWVSPSSYTSLTQTTSAGGVTATVTARPVSTVWATGSADAPRSSATAPACRTTCAARLPSSRRTAPRLTRGRAPASHGPVPIRTTGSSLAARPPSGASAGPGLAAQPARFPTFADPLHFGSQ